MPLEPVKELDRLDSCSDSERAEPGRALVTGCAGFLGSTLSEALVARGCEVVGVDCFTDFYPRSLKEDNLSALKEHSAFTLRELDLSQDSLGGLLEGIDRVYHLAAQPGVSQSFGATFRVYVERNVLATQSLLEEAIRSPVDKLVYASSSSVYGDAEAYPTSEAASLHPVSPYGLTKVATEELADLYRRVFGVPTVGLRYFTAYGPRQRPDMAFTRMLVRAVGREPLTIFGDGRQVRDFTFVDDVVDGTIKAAEHGEPGAVYNIGGAAPVELREAVEIIEQLVGHPLRLDRRQPRLGDARHTACDPSLAERELGYTARTSLAEGLRRQLDWIAGSEFQRSWAVMTG